MFSLAVTDFAGRDLIQTPLALSLSIWARQRSEPGRFLDKKRRGCTANQHVNLNIVGHLRKAELGSRRFLMAMRPSTRRDPY